MNNQVTTPNYWDCECEVDYIHPKSKESCQLCGVSSEDSPDSHISEVLNSKVDMDIKIEATIEMGISLSREDFRCCKEDTQTILKETSEELIQRLVLGENLIVFPMDVHIEYVIFDDVEYKVLMDKEAT